MPALKLYDLGIESGSLICRILSTPRCRENARVQPSRQTKPDHEYPHRRWNEGASRDTGPMSKKEDSILKLLRCPPREIDVVRDFETDATPGYPKGHDKNDADALKAELDDELDEMQEQLYAYGLSHPTGRPASC